VRRSRGRPLRIDIRLAPRAAVPDRPAADVFLHHYDLSNGLAAALSPALLGVAVGTIPHTGIVLRGEEIFFGGGIQRCPPSVFAASHGGLAPVERARLGPQQRPFPHLHTRLRACTSM
jgi:hypothetical protein